MGFLLIVKLQGHFYKDRNTKNNWMYGQPAKLLFVLEGEIHTFYQTFHIFETTCDIVFPKITFTCV